MRRRGKGWSCYLWKDLSMFEPIFVHWKLPARGPLGKVFVSYETRSLSCDNKNSLFNKNSLLGNYLIKLFILEYIYGEEAIFNFWQMLDFRERTCNSGIQRSVNLWRWSLGRRVAIRNVQNAGNHATWSVFEVWAWQLIRTLQSVRQPVLFKFCSH